jgi:hypothetical protein
MSDLALSALEFVLLAAGLLAWPQGVLAWLLIAKGHFLLACVALATTFVPTRVRFVERIIVRPVAGGSRMTIADAYACLGCHPSADSSSIAAAYRQMMRRVHPDAGGTQYLAARVNEAKTILLRRSP